MVAEYVRVFQSENRSMNDAFRLDNPWREFSKAIGYVLAALLLIAVVLFGLWSLIKLHRQHQRTEWMPVGLKELAGLSITDKAIHHELDDLNVAMTNTFTERHHWTSDHLLLMTNGEYIFYVFRHGNEGVVDHLFLGHASDGRWFYTTYHFCIMRGLDAPGSIAEFTKTYFAREFDGKSDVCLQHTWP
ncbi:MAG: hypothetical protein C5B50_23135 [Verrucomicrobia bacterium]|nr:MAG: hypothetical protein C5B50_23135 [Verrucomicrobiota bacterium]